MVFSGKERKVFAVLLAVRELFLMESEKAQQVVDMEWMSLLEVLAVPWYKDVGRASVAGVSLFRAGLK